MNPENLNKKLVKKVLPLLYKETTKNEDLIGLDLFVIVTYTRIFDPCE